MKIHFALMVMVAEATTNTRRLMYSSIFGLTEEMSTQYVMQEYKRPRIIDNTLIRNHNGEVLAVSIMDFFDVAFVEASIQA